MSARVLAILGLAVLPLIPGSPGPAFAAATDSPTVTRFAVPSDNSHPGEIVQGPDGALWFTQNLSSQIGRIDTDGTITEYPTQSTSSAPQNIVVGPDNALWFSEATPSRIGRITTDGQLTEYAIPGGGLPAGITVGSDGNIYFTLAQTAQVGGFQPQGGRFLGTTQLTPGTNPGGITTGPDGNL